MKISKSIYPNAFTFGNMFFGLLSIMYSFDGNFTWAAYFIVLGAVCDSLDGIVARLVKASSAIGVQLDSLADAITFGVAPTILVYQFSLHSFDWVGLLISSLLMFGGAYRLARFNVQLVGFDKDYFNGLPIPAQAVTICTFILSSSWLASNLSFNTNFVLIPLVILLAFLMVSTIKYDTLPKFNKAAYQKEPIKIFGFIGFIILIIWLHIPGVFIGMIIYILYGILKAVFKHK